MNCCTRCRRDIKTDRPSYGKRLGKVVLKFRWYDGAYVRQNATVRGGWCQLCTASFETWYDQGAHS